MANYATVQDVIDLYRPLSPSEETRAENYLPIISARLRQEGRKVGKDLDQMIADDSSGDLAAVAKMVTVDVIKRVLMTPTSSIGDLGPMTQMTQSAGGYSATGTFLNPGGGLLILKSELAQLGLRRQMYGAMEIYADPRDNNKTLAED